MSNPNQKVLKIFLNSMHTWFSNFLIEELRTDHIPKEKIQYTFMGTTEPSEPLPYLFEPKIITIKPGYDYNQEIFNNDIIIFNLNEANLDEVEYVIRGLDIKKYESQKMLILISNIMTWANTPLKEYNEEEINKIDISEKGEEIEEFLYNKIFSKVIEEKKESDNGEDKMSFDSENGGSSGNNDQGENNQININSNPLINDENAKEEVIKEENEEEIESNEGSKVNIIQNENIQNNNIKNGKKIFYFNENDYPKRIPYSVYYNFKLVETMALQIKNPNLKKYIICPGFIYGCGEDFFFDYFKKAWLGGIEYFPIRGNGYNFIPTIHIKDLIRIIKKVINIKPENNYIFACDKTREPFMRDILESITKGIGGIKLKSINEYDIDEFEITNYRELKINIPMKLSSFLAESDTKNSINWHCEFGIKENISKLIDEFKLYRQINSLRVIIAGPPSGGKSSLAEMLSKKFRISRFDVKNILDWAENDIDLGLSQEIKQKKEEMEEIIKKALEEHEHKKGKKKSDPPLDVSALKKFPNDFIGKLFKERIKRDECLMKGYILDNFPKSYVDSQNIFCVELPPKIKTEEEIKEEKEIKENPKSHKDKKDKEKEKEKIEEIDYNREVIKDSLPDCVIMITNYNEESLKNKMQKNPEYNEKQQELDTRFNRRLETYKKYNESHDTNYRNLEDFFKENNVKIFYVNGTEYMENKTKIEENLIQDLEKSGFTENYSKLFDEEDEVEFIKPIIEEKEKEKEKEENMLNLNEEENKEITDENKVSNILEENKNKNKNIDVIKEDESEESMIRIQKKAKKETMRGEKEKHEISISKHKPKVKHSIIKEKFKENQENSGESSKKRKSGLKSTETKQIKISKIKTEKEQIDDLKEREQILLEKKSEIIRRYISENIMPILAKGVLFVSRNLPDDPVEALANFLMYNSFDLAKETDKNMGELEKMIQDTDH